MDSNNFGWYRMNKDEHYVPTEEEVAASNRKLKWRAQRQQLLQSLEMRLGVRIGYIEGLLKEPDDWSFIIKLAVLTEAAVTSTVVLCLKNEHLYDYVAGLNNSQRLKLANTLGIFEKGDWEILNSLASVRNSFAHNVKNLERTLEEYFVDLPNDRKIELLTKLVGLEGSDKPKTTDDFSGHARFFRLLICTAVIRPLLSIATIGQAMQRDEERKMWGVGSLNDLFKIAPDAFSN